MNKEKVIEHLDSVCSCLNGPTSDTLDFTEMTDEIDEAIRELNSKVTMPESFDKWHKIELELCSCYQDEIIDLLTICTTDYVHMSNDEIELQKWMNRDDPITYPKNFLMCIDAIRNGYEVEK